MSTCAAWCTIRAIRHGPAVRPASTCSSTVAVVVLSRPIVRLARHSVGFGATWWADFVYSGCTLLRGAHKHGGPGSQMLGTPSVLIVTSWRPKSSIHLSRRRAGSGLTTTLRRGGLQQKKHASASVLCNQRWGSGHPLR